MFASFSDRILLRRKPRAGLETHKIHQWIPEYMISILSKEQKKKKKKKSYEIKFACLTDFVIFKRQEISAPRTTKKKNFSVAFLLKIFRYENDWSFISISFFISLWIFNSNERTFLLFFFSFNVLFEVNKQLSMLGCHFDGNINKKKKRKKN